MASRFKQGHFEPKNPGKYKGNVPIVFRSSWELKFMKWCDENPAIILWISETVFVHYHNPIKQRIARYFPDFIIKLRNKHGEVKQYLIEVKPLKETVPPQKKRGKRKATMLYEQMTWATNQAKWAAAKVWARKHSMEFLIITEKTLYPHRN